MSIEAIGLVTTALLGITTALVGLAGTYFAWRIAKHGHDHAERMAHQSYAYEWFLAKDARDQARLEKAYVMALDMAERAGQWAQLGRPMMEANLPEPLPKLPTLEEQAHVHALVCAFGSVKVEQSLTKWLEVVQEMLRVDELIKWDEGGGGRRDMEPRPRKQFDELRDKERSARSALADQVAVELGHRTAGEQRQDQRDPE